MRICDEKVQVCLKINAPNNRLTLKNISTFTLSAPSGRFSKNIAMLTKITTGLFTLLLLVACTYTLKIKDGRTAYERKQFSVAAPMLEKEFARAKTRNEKGQIAYLLGDSYRRIGRDEKSLQWFKTAYDNNGGAEALKAQAFALKKMERYTEAREAFKNLGIEIGSPYEYRK